MTEYMVACQTADSDDEGWSLTFMADVDSPDVFAAAPDLLALLERLAQWDMLWIDPRTGKTSGMVADGNYWRHEIDAAIAKAKGIES